MNADLADEHGSRQEILLQISENPPYPRSSTFYSLVPFTLSHCLVVMLLLVLFFWRLGARDLWSSHEGRAAMNARSVLSGASWLPHLDDGRAEVQKPPLYYWLVAGVAWLRGGEVDALAV